jgi:signal transduction histidine kinase/tetratricopeptide (TPR) repeat protein
MNSSMSSVKSRSGINKFFRADVWTSFKKPNVLMKQFIKQVTGIEDRIRQLGTHSGLSRYEKRKIGIFNLLNFIIGITLGLVIPLMARFGGLRLSNSYWLVLSGGPLLVTVVTAILTYGRRYEASQATFFILHPLLLTCIYLLKIDVGTDLFFICFGVLCVFFLQNVHVIIFSFCFSMTCYFLSMGLERASGYSLESAHLDLYLFNRLIAIFFIFYGIFIVRNANHRYQVQMQQQASQLSELNSLKNKLFSVIGHDLRGPLYALQYLFRNMVTNDLPADEIKLYVPEVARDLADITGQIENLLQWAKSQMRAEVIEPQVLDLSKVVMDVMTFLRLQVEGKQLLVESKMERSYYVYADKEMINLVLRNLLSNAIKFTPERGSITLGALDNIEDIEVFVQDNGMGMSAEKLEQLEQGLAGSTLGTGGEGGTGLGLLLCKEFLIRNGSRLRVQSQPGKGSTFSFMLRKYAILTLVVFLGIRLPAIQAQSLREYSVLADTTSDSGKATRYFALSYRQWQKDADSVLLYGEVALEAAQKGRYEKGIALALLSKGVGYNLKEEQSAALDCFLQALRIVERVRMPGMLANLYNEIGIVYADQENYQQSNGYYRLSFQLASGDRQTEGILLANMAENYKHLGEYDSALNYNARALPIVESVRDSSALAAVLLNTGEDHSYKGEYELALTAFRRGADIAGRIQDQEDLAWAAVSMADLRLRQRYYRESIHLADAALRNARRYSFTEVIRKCYSVIYAGYEGLGDYKAALTYRNIEVAWKDSLYGLAKQKKIAALESEYDLEKKQYQIDLLKEKALIQEKEVGRLRERHFMFAGIALFFSLWAIFLFRTNKEMNRLNDRLRRQGSAFQKTTLSNESL